MKIELAEKTTIFKPISICLSIESKEELEMLYDLSCLNETIPSRIGKAKDLSLIFLNKLRLIITNLRTT